MKYISLLLMLAVLLGCSTAPTVKSWLDPVSSVTITAQVQPLILARDEQTRADDERDFAQLTALELNRMGERRLYLVATLWSSEHRTRIERDNFEGTFARIELQIGDRSVVIARHQGEIADLGVSQSPLPLPIPGSQQFYFPIARADLHALASSNRVQLIAQGLPGTPQRYDEFQGGRRSLNDFLSRLPTE